MKESKNRNFKLFYIIIWSILFLFSLFLLFRCIMVFGSEGLEKNSRSIGVNIVSTACNYMIHSGIPILDYISSQEAGDANVILNSLAGVFPINRYVEETGGDSGGYENAGNSLLLNQSFNLLFQDGNTYNNGSQSQSGEDDGTGTMEEDSGEDNTDSTSLASNNGENGMSIDIIKGDVYLEEEDTEVEDSEEAKETLGTVNGESFTLSQLENRQFLYQNFYIVDSATEVQDDLFDAKILLGKDMKIKTDSDNPQILIYHTHSQEAYIDSRTGKEADTVVGLGSILTELLTKKGFQVIHDKSKYDIMGGDLDRNLAYTYACEGITKILEENPTIEVIIDIHRDGVSKDLPKGQGKRLSNINGKDVAQIMPFNGLSRNTQGEITYLKNPYLQDNLAFSLQIQLKGREMYPGLMYKNYLKDYRYNAHLRKKSLMIEVGTDRNTLEEAENAIELFAGVIYEILEGE